MTLYSFVIALGFFGLLAMALMGTGHGHVGHAHAGQTHDLSTPGSPSFLLWLSPRLLFSVLLGVGLCGWLLTAFVHALSLPVNQLTTSATFGLSVLGGLLFERFLIRPYWNMLLLFESRPAQSLSSRTWQRAEAVTDFDAQGSGLVRFEYEGEVRQLLATLTPEERSAQVKVRRGDQVRLEEIVENQNRCIVSASLILNLHSPDKGKL